MRCRGFGVWWRRRELNPGPVKAPIGFLHAYFLIRFSCAKLAQERGRSAPYPQKFRSLAEAFRWAIPKLVDTRYAVYRKSSARHNGLLIPRIRQPWHTDSCHLIVECHFLRSDHPCSGMLTYTLSSLSIPVRPQLLRWWKTCCSSNALASNGHNFLRRTESKGNNFLGRQKVSVCHDDK